MTEANVLLNLSGIVKQFPGVLALDRVDFEVRAGEVHALMGENGAGKSTLIKVATGVYPANGGEMTLGGSPFAPRSPDEAVRLGISTVYQEVNLVPNLSVAENVCLGREPAGPFGIRWRAVRARAEEALKRIDLTLDVRRPLSSCSIAIQQMVAIARALDVSAKVLVLDEPTSSLDAHEVAQLFAVVRRLRGEGMGIVFVTHFLDQVYEVSDRITILRNGQKVGVWNTADLPRLELVTQMIGRDAATLERPASALAPAGGKGEPVVAAENLGRRGAISDATFTVRSGEVLGLAGLLGSGRTETMRLLFGLDHPDEGCLKVDGRDTGRFSPREAIRNGFGFCSEDRKTEGVFPEMSIRENILIALQARRGWLRPLPATKQREMADELIARLRVQPADAERPIQFLSGGNQQKALLARWLAIEPRLLLLDEPTRGIDVGAKFEIMSLVESLRQQGASFVFVSSELSEVVRTCTSVLVMRDRRAVKTLEGSAISEENIIGAIAGDQA
ncbi:MAG TPA: sugar ABC transporter ATP-binding protein [Fimbriimonadaceae bacterium]|nr:sugar ABC transporter ATP-binding protein [Fimbriimonadaceae bacterium]